MIVQHYALGPLIPTLHCGPCRLPIPSTLLTARPDFYTVPAMKNSNARRRFGWTSFSSFIQQGVLINRVTADMNKRGICITTSKKTRFTRLAPTSMRKQRRPGSFPPGNSPSAKAGWRHMFLIGVHEGSGGPPILPGHFQRLK